MSPRIPWITLVWALLLPVAWIGTRLLDLGLRFPPCPFKAFTGLPCAACGATRSVMALGHGHLVEALHWHPILVLLLLLSPLAVVWDLRRAWRGEAYPALPDSAIWRWGALGVFLGTWLLQILRGI